MNCPVSGKHQWESNQSARLALARQKARGAMTDPDALHVYRCEHCGHFHYGHRPWTRSKAKLGPTARKPRVS